MKSKALNRPMFLDVENVGIMQGFKDADEGMVMGGEYDTGAMLERTPSSPEILMNNLRGDMRSIDARMEELAQLVGEEAAMDTPAEVLALLQPVLARQEGIGSLPAGMPDQSMGSPTPPPSPMGDAMPAPDMGMMPPDMGMMPQDMMPVDVPPGPPPTAQAPLQMAEGGFVQRFREGSDEEGVTPVDDDIDPSSARASLRSLDARMPSLRQEYQAVLPTYQEALGGSDRSMTQSQILFDIAQAGLNLAAGTDAQGKRVRPGASFASSLAAAAQGVPERIAARVGQMEQQEQGVSLAALRGAETSLAAKMKAMKGEELFGKGSWEYSVINRPGLMDRWSRGEVTPEEETQVQSAIAKLAETRIEFRPDPVSKQLVPVQVAGTLPRFVQEYMALRNFSPPSLSDTDKTDKTDAEIDATIVRDAEGNIIDVGRTVAPDAPSAEVTRLKETAVVPTEGGAPSRGGIFKMSSFIAGPIPGIGAILNKTPGLGAPFPSIPAAQKAAALEVESLISAFVKSGRASLQEQERLREVYDISPKLFDDPAALRQRLIAIDEELLKEIDLAKRKANNTTLAPKAVGEAREFLVDAIKFRKALGVPPRIYTQEAANALGPDVEYLWQGRDLYKTPSAKGKK